MSRIRLYIEPARLADIITIDSTEQIHKMRDVLRLYTGSEIYVFDGEGHEYLYTIPTLKQSCLTLQKIKLNREEKYQQNTITLGFPLLRDERVEFILQKATELGVSELIPFISERTIIKKSSLNKLARFRKIIIEATRQSERLWLPVIHEMVPFARLIVRQYTTKLLATISGEEFSSVLPNLRKEIFILVGPEGDFSETEYRSLKDNNFIPVVLSKNILRVETACIFAVGLLNYFLNTQR